MDLGLAGKVALVTGGTRGIGRAIATTLAAEGCSVGLCARDGDEARKVAAELGEAHTGRFHGAGADVLDEDAIAAWVAEAAAELGGVDHLVANVGGAFGGRELLDATAEEWARSYSLNVGHAVAALRACAGPMTERGGGSAVFISSVSGAKPQPRAQYGSAKAALDYAAAALARELGARNIRVNSIAPGSILFPGGSWDDLRRTDGARFAAFAAGEFPARRLGSAPEVARVVAFVLSDAASWVNGTTIAVDGAQNAPSAAGY